MSLDFLVGSSANESDGSILEIETSVVDITGDIERQCCYVSQTLLVSPPNERK